MKNTNYNKNEDIFLRLAFPEFGAKALSKYIDRSPDSILHRAKRLSLKFFGEVFYINQKFGKLTIKKVLCFSDRKKKYECICDCSPTIIREISHNRLKFDNTKSCGCLKIEKSSRKVGEIAGIYYTRYKLAAKHSGKEFQISKEYLANLFEEQERKCALTGLSINIVFGNDSKGSTASIDRKDSSKGYIEGNVQFVHVDINRMKLHHEQNYFINLCKLVAAKAENGDENVESKLKDLGAEHQRIYKYRPTVTPK